MILGLDLATRTGFAWGRGDTLPVVGSHVLPRTGEQVGPYLAAFEDWLRALLARVRPTNVVFESPVLGRMATVQVTRKLHALPGIVELVCCRLGLNVAEASPATVKKTLTGNGRADKAEMVRCARALGLPITIHDEADAFGVWLTALGRYRPEAAAVFTPVFAWGRK